MTKEELTSDLYNIVEAIDIALKLKATPNEILDAHSPITSAIIDVMDKYRSGLYDEE